MIRGFNGLATRLVAVVVTLGICGLAPQAQAQDTTPVKKAVAKQKPEAVGKATTGKAAKGKAKIKAEAKASTGKPAEVGTYGDWKAYVTQGAKDKTCYALAQPKERLPANLKRDPGYIFIATRPAENVKNEVSIIMGFGVKEGGDASAEIGGVAFELLGKGPNAWIKNAAKEPQFVEALRKGSKLTVKAPSLKGNVTTDHYSLIGLGLALDRVAKECK